MVHLKLSVAFAGVQGFAVFAAGIAALIAKAPGVPGWAVVIIAAFAGVFAAALSTPPDLVVQLAFLFCALIGTALGLVWGRRGAGNETASRH